MMYYIIAILRGCRVNYGNAPNSDDGIIILLSYFIADDK